MERNLNFLLIVFLLCTPLLILGTETELKLIKTIGSNDENYIIFGLADALINDCEDIYILNARGNFISHYNWQGKYIDKIGQPGSGPGDFSFPHSIDFYNSKLFILDKGNRRLVEFNVKTQKFNFYRNDQKASFSGRISILNDDELLGIFQFSENQRGRIGIINKNGSIIHSFFEETPLDIDYIKGSIEESDNMEKTARKMISSSLFQPIYTLSTDKTEILVSFKLPDNPIRFFVYDINGKIKKKFSYSIADKKYKFSDFFFKASIEKMRNPDLWPDRYEPLLDSICIYNNHYLAFLKLCSYKKKEMIENQNYCLIFNTDGVLEDIFPIDNKLRMIRYSNGYFLGTGNDEDVEKLYIYKIQLNLN